MKSNHSQVQIEDVGAENRDANGKGNILPIPCATSVPDTFFNQEIAKVEKEMELAKIVIYSEYFSITDSRKKKMLIEDVYYCSLQAKLQTLIQCRDEVIKAFDKLPFEIHHVVNGNLSKEILDAFEEGRKCQETSWKNAITKLKKELGVTK